MGFKFNCLVTHNRERILDQLQRKINSALTSPERGIQIQVHVLVVEGKKKSGE